MEEGETNILIWETALGNAELTPANDFLLFIDNNNYLQHLNSTLSHSETSSER